MPRGRQIIDLTGQKFGKVTVLRMSENKTERGRVLWVCKCECGKEFERDSAHLKYGRTRTCGCDFHDVRSRASTLHGASGGGTYPDRLYRIWRGMKGRCSCPNVPYYKHYGARGIKVCDEWLGRNGFLNFREWALASGYKENLTIDRIDVNGNYEPSNCKWATYKEQENNRSNNTLLDINGEIMTLSEYCEMTGETRRRALTKNKDNIVQRVARKKDG